VAFNIFLCFFLRMRLRRFLISEPMSTGTLVDQVVFRHVGPSGPSRPAPQSSSASVSGGVTSGRLNRKTAPPPSAW
jgi:hypothetical protein